jgi:D-aminopeptidase
MKRRHFLRTGLAVSAPILGGMPFELGPALAATAGVGERPRLRDLGIAIGSLPTATHNAITDVPGVHVGHATIIRGEGPLVAGEGPVRTGVTVILPRPDPDNVSRHPVRAADWTLNGNGELTGLGPVRRQGMLGSPIYFTDTGCVGTVYDAAMGHLLASDPQVLSQAFRPEPVVGETWAGFLNDTAGRHVGETEVRAALAAAKNGSGEVAEGSVGGGTGMRAYGFKAGIGTASRVITCSPARQYTVGVLVQANHGRRHQLTVQGVRVGAEIPDLLPTPGKAAASGHSLLVAIATDAPLLPIQLQRLCKRSALGMARTGGISTHGSGDLSIAFSTATTIGREDAGIIKGEMLHFSQITGLHQAVVEATEEAILNALTAARTMVGRDGNRIFALPLDRFVDVMRRHDRLK